MKEIENEYHKFEANLIGVFPLTLIMDIPEPDPIKKILKQKEMMVSRNNLFQETDCLQRIIERLGKE